MFAVIKTGGKQYSVKKNDVIKIEKLDAAKAGDVVLFDQVLAVGSEGGKTTIGTPLVKDIKVSGEVLEQKKADKVIIFKKKRRHNYRRKKGHRQNITVVRIQEIGKDLKAKAATAEESAAKQEAKKNKNTKPAAKKTAAKKETKKAEGDK